MGDLLADVYELLWRPAPGQDQGCNLLIPDTVVYRNRAPACWYFTSLSGVIKRRRTEKCTTPHVLEAFKRRHPTDAAATFFGPVALGSVVYAVGQVAARERASLASYGSALTVATAQRPTAAAPRSAAVPSEAPVATGRILCTAEMDAYLLFDNASRADNGVLQQFALPKAAGAAPLRNSVIRATWSPGLCLLEQRTCLRQLGDHKHATVEDRALTYEAGELQPSAASEPVHSLPVLREAQRICEKIAGHIAAVTLRRCLVSRMAVHLKVVPDVRPHHGPQDMPTLRMCLLWVSDVRWHSPHGHSARLAPSIACGAGSSSRRPSVGICTVKLPSTAKAGARPAGAPEASGCQDVNSAAATNCRHRSSAASDTEVHDNFLASAAIADERSKPRQLAYEGESEREGEPERVMDEHGVPLQGVPIPVRVADMLHADSRRLRRAGSARHLSLLNARARVTASRAGQPATHANVASVIHVAPRLLLPHLPNTTGGARAAGLAERGTGAAPAGQPQRLALLVLPLTGRSAHAQAAAQRARDTQRARLGQALLPEPRWQCPSCGRDTAAVTLQYVSAGVVARHYCELVASLRLRPRELDGIVGADHATRGGGDAALVTGRFARRIVTSAAQARRRNSDELAQNCYWPPDTVALRAAAGVGVQFALHPPTDFERRAAPPLHSTPYYLDKWLHGHSAVAAVGDNGKLLDITAGDTAGHALGDSTQAAAGADARTADSGGHATGVLFGPSRLGKPVVRLLPPTLARAFPELTLHTYCSILPVELGAADVPAAAPGPLVTADENATTSYSARTPVPVCESCFIVYQAFDDVVLEGKSPAIAMQMVVQAHHTGGASGPRAVSAALHGRLSGRRLPASGSDRDGVGVRKRSGGAIDPASVHQRQARGQEQRGDNNWEVHAASSRRPFVDPTRVRLKRPRSAPVTLSPCPDATTSARSKPAALSPFAPRGPNFSRSRPQSIDRLLILQGDASGWHSSDFGSATADTATGPPGSGLRPRAAFPVPPAVLRRPVSAGALPSRDWRAEVGSRPASSGSGLDLPALRLDGPGRHTAARPGSGVDAAGADATPLQSPSHATFGSPLSTLSDDIAQVLQRSMANFMHSIHSLTAGTRAGTDYYPDSATSTRKGSDSASGSSAESSSAYAALSAVSDAAFLQHGFRPLVSNVADTHALATDGERSRTTPGITAWRGEGGQQAWPLEGPGTSLKDLEPRLTPLAPVAVTPRTTTAPSRDTAARAALPQQAFEAGTVRRVRTSERTEAQVAPDGAAAAAASPAQRSPTFHVSGGLHGLSQLRELLAIKQAEEHQRFQRVRQLRREQLAAAAARAAAKSRSVVGGMQSPHGHSPVQATLPWHANGPASPYARPGSGPGPVALSWAEPGSIGRAAYLRLLGPYGAAVHVRKEALAARLQRAADWAVPRVQARSCPSPSFQAPPAPATAARRGRTVSVGGGSGPGRRAASLSGST
jgi:hypothetical protein